MHHTRVILSMLKLRRSGLLIGGLCLMDGTPEGVLTVLIQMIRNGAFMMVHLRPLDLLLERKLI